MSTLLPLAPSELEAMPVCALQHLSFPDRTLRLLSSLLLAFACTIPLLAIKLPPMTDVLGHIGRYSIQVGIDDHPWLRQYFSFDWKLIGNLGADALVQILAPRWGVETSVKLILILDQFLAGLGIVLLCREVHGRITPFCLFALPLIYGHPFNYGFVNFSLSMSLAFMGFLLWLRLERTRAYWLRAGLFVVLSVVLWLCHTFGWGFLGILCTAQSLAVVSERDRRWWTGLLETARRCLPLLAPIVPMLLWRANGAGGDTVGWFFILAKLSWLITVFRLEFPLVDLFCAAGVIVLIYIALRIAKLCYDQSLLIATGICAVTYLVLPLRVFGSFYADMRLAPYLLIIALLSIRTEGIPKRWHCGLMVAGTTFLILRLTLTTSTYFHREQKLDAILEALSAMPERARVLSLVKVECAGWQLPWLTHVGSMAIARKHAFSNDQWNTPGMNLLTVHYPQAGDFMADESQFIADPSCPDQGWELDKAVAAFPAQAFTHLWIVGVTPRGFPKRDDLQMIWSGPDSAVYRIDLRKPYSRQGAAAGPIFIHRH